MKKNGCLFKVAHNINKGYISLRKNTMNSSPISISIKVKNRFKFKKNLDNEIDIKDILITMINRTNKMYDSFQFNSNYLKLDNNEYCTRAKIIKNIKDFIFNNSIFQNNSKKSPDNTYCEIIYFFDLLIIQNKKHNLMYNLEKLGVGALILVVKFNKLQEKILIKKYKSIINDKYMTLEEINKIEILSLKLIEYYIIQPNHVYFLDFLLKNIFMNNKSQNLNYIAKYNILLLKNIMSFSNNYIKYHPFYLSCFIIKYSFEQNKIDGFQKTLIDIFDLNMRVFRNTYDEFLKYNNNQMKIVFNLEKIIEDENKAFQSKKSENNSVINKKLHNFDKYKSNTINNFYNIIKFNSSKKDKKLLNHYPESRHLVNIRVNPMKNTYYKKFLENYLSENTKNLSIYGGQNQTLNINKVDTKDSEKINAKRKNFTIESPKKCGILINYRTKRKFSEKNRIFNNKLIAYNLIKKKENKTILNNLKKNNTNKENNNEINNENRDENYKNNENLENKNYETIEAEDRENYYKRVNSELSNCTIQRNCSSIRKTYKSKKKNLKENNSNISNNSNNNNKITKNENLYENKNDKKFIFDSQKKEKKNINIKAFLEKKKNYKRFPNKNIIIDDSNLKSTINQPESSFSNCKDNNIIENIRVQKMHIRNFYKQKNSFVFNNSNLGTTKKIL